MAENDRIARIMTGLSHPRRVAIFQALETAGEKGLGVEELLEKARLQPSTLTHHLKPMIAAGLVRRRRIGLPIRLYLDGRRTAATVSDITERIASAPRPRHPAFIEKASGNQPVAHAVH